MRPVNLLAFIKYFVMQLNRIYILFYSCLKRNYRIGLPAYRAFLLCRHRTNKFCNILTSTFNLFLLQIRYAMRLAHIASNKQRRPSDKADKSNLSPVIVIIANSTANTEPRLLRECALAREHGLYPFVICLPCPQEPATPNNLFHRISVDLLHNNYSLNLSLFWTSVDQLYRDISTLPIIVRFFNLSIHTKFLLAFLRYLSTNLHVDFVRTVEALSWLSKFYDVRCVIAHDYYTYPPGILASTIFKCPLVYDIHEHAFSQYDTHEFKTQFVPYLYDLHQACFECVDALGIVSGGIQYELIREFPQIKSKSHLLRNLPFLDIQSESLEQRNQSSFKGVDDHISILYSGLITCGRGLENLLLSIPLLHKRFHIYLLGPMCSDSVDVFNLLHEDDAISERLHIIEPVPFSQIISMCSNFDIGYLVQPLYGPQKQFSLANKFFEYIHSDMMLCTDTSREMGTIVDQYSLGVTIDELTPERVASKLNNLTIAEIRSFQNSSSQTKSLFEFHSDTDWLVSLFTLGEEVPLC